MTPVPPHDPAAALNEVLSEVVDLVLALTAGASRGREGQELDTELHQLFTSGRTRSELLVDVDTSIRSRDAQDPVPILVTGRTGVITPVPRHRAQTNYEAVT